MNPWNINLMKSPQPLLYVFSTIFHFPMQAHASIVFILISGSPEFSACCYFDIFLKKIIFSFISGNLFVVWPFCFAFSILHWFYLVCCHSDSFLFMCGWICEGVGLRCSPRRTLCPSCSSPVVPSINVSCPSPQKMLGNNVIVFWGHDICMVAWENPSHGHIWCYIFGKLQASLKWNVLLFCTDPQTWKRGKLHLNISFQFQSKTPHLHLLQNLLMEKKLN